MEIILCYQRDAKYKTFPFVAIGAHVATAVRRLLVSTHMAPKFVAYESLLVLLSGWKLSYDQLLMILQMLTRVFI